MRSPRFFLRVGVVVGALLLCTPLLGIAGIMRALDTLRQSGIGDPRSLSGAIAETMLMTASGFILFPAGIVLLIVCLWQLRRLRTSGPPPLPRFLANSENPP